MYAVIFVKSRERGGRRIMSVSFFMAHFKGDPSETAWKILSLSLEFRRVLPRLSKTPPHSYYILIFFFRFTLISTALREFVWNDSELSLWFISMRYYAVFLKALPGKLVPNIGHNGHLLLNTNNPSVMDSAREHLWISFTVWTLKMLWFIV